jgi:hypothetical protein
MNNLKAIHLKLRADNSKDEGIEKQANYLLLQNTASSIKIKQYERNEDYIELTFRNI